jgi:hypothetical protein
LGAVSSVRDVLTLRDHGNLFVHPNSGLH